MAAPLEGQHELSSPPFSKLALTFLQRKLIMINLAGTQSKASSPYDVE